MKRLQFIKKISLGIGAMLAAPKIVEGLGENSPELDGIYPIVISSDQARQLEQDPAWMPISKKFSKQAQANRMKYYRDMQKDIMHGAMK